MNSSLDSQAEGIPHVATRYFHGWNIVFAMQIAAMGILLAADGAVVFAACALFGLGVGNLITFPALIVQREYPAEHFTRVVSLIVTINQLTFAFGPALLGLSRDWSGSYET